MLKNVYKQCVTNVCIIKVSYLEYVLFMNITAQEYNVAS